MRVSQNVSIGWEMNYYNNNSCNGEEYQNKMKKLFEMVNRKSLQIFMTVLAIINIDLKVRTVLFKFVLC